MTQRLSWPRRGGVVFVSVVKRDAGLSAAMTATAESAIEQVRSYPARGIPDALASQQRMRANLLVMGAYGRSRGRESCWQLHRQHPRSRNPAYPLRH